MEKSVNSIADDLECNWSNSPDSKFKQQSSDFTKEAPLPDVADSSWSEAIHLIKSGTRHPSPLKWLVAPYCFLYIASYVTSSTTFTQFIYDKLQKDMYPDIDTFNSTLGCYSNKSDPDYKRQISVQEKASEWSMYFSLAAGVPAILSNIVFGSLTDKFGRRFLFFVPCIGTFVRLMVASVGIYFNFNLVFFIIGSIAEGLTGQLFTMLLVCFTYVSDMTEANGKERTFAIVLIELSIGISASVFYFTTGYFIQTCGFFYPMLSVTIIIVLSFVIALFIPESFPKEGRDVSASTFHILKTSYDLFIGSANKGHRWMFCSIMMVFLLSIFASFGCSNIEPLYQLDAPFCWSPEKLGYYATLRSMTQQIVGMGLVKVAQIFMSDEAIAILGCASFSISKTVEGVATSDALMYAVPVIGAGGLLTVPMCRAILSKLTPSNKQGAVFAAIATVETAINVCSSVAANEIYSHTLNFYKGFVFFIFAACYLVNILIMGKLPYGRMFFTSACTGITLGSVAEVMMYSWDDVLMFFGFAQKERPKDDLSIRGMNKLRDRDT